MKKLKYLFCFLFVLFALGSFSVFAEESVVDFRDYFRIYRFLAHNVPADDFDYKYSGVGETGWRDGYETVARWDGDGIPPESYAYSFRMTFSRQNDGNPVDNSTMLPPGYILSGTLRFQLQFRTPYDYGETFDPNDLQHAIVMLYDYPDGDFWSITGRTKVSDIKFIGSTYEGDYGTLWECSADFYFHNNTNDYIDMRKNSFQFMFRFKNASSFSCVERSAFFIYDIDDFYYGKANNPSAPSFKDYNVYNEIITEEDNFVNDAVEGYTDATEKFEDIAELLNPSKETSAFFIFGSSMLFITALFEHLLARISLLEAVLYVSIFFGLCGFFLNILPSMVSNFKHLGNAEKVSNDKKGDSA